MKNLYLLTVALLLAGSSHAQLIRIPVNDGFEEDPTSFVNLNGLTYFIAYNNNTGYELFKTDGTPTGTQLVADINPGPTSALYGSALTVFNNELYFFANNGTLGFELWKSNGTAAGTTLVKDIYPGANSGINYYTNTPRFTMAANSQYLYFFARDSATDSHYGLWRSDGTAAGTVFLKAALASGTVMTMFGDGNLLYFRASLAGLSAGDELCVTDGTPAGTSLLKDINPGTTSSTPANFIKLGSNILFTATGPDGTELYTTDGTAAGTVLLKDINPYGNSGPAYLTRFNNQVLFYANDSTHGAEPWTTDGTPGGTQMLYDIMVGAASSGTLIPFVVANNKAFFACNSQFWYTDGTTAGTNRFMNNFVPTSSVNNFCVRGGNRVYFLVRNSSISVDIWSTTSGLDTVRHTFYNASYANLLRMFSSYSALLVTRRRSVDPVNELWKLDYDICSPAAAIAGNLSLTCNNHQSTLAAGNFDVYNWSTGATTPQITVSTPGTYSVTVYDTIVGCSSNATANVTLLSGSNVVPVPQICAVTVDSITQRNMIVWNKHGSRSGADFYTLEKETATNVFTPLAYIPYDSLSLFVDTSGNPQVTSYRYRLLLTDTCGNTSAAGNAHRTVHLAQNIGIGGEVNLAWNPYEGNTYTQVNVLRNVNGGAWTTLTTLPGNVASYSDLTPPAGSLNYIIETLLDSSCTPSRAITTIYSNTVNYITTGIGTVANGSIALSPNPAGSILYITVPQAMQNSTFAITDLTGRTVSSVAINGTATIQHDIAALAPGVYLLSPTSKAVPPLRFVKQ